jgi:hypothetical protein
MPQMQPSRVLDYYRPGRKTSIRWAGMMVLGGVLGLWSGILWIIVGDRLDDVLPRFIAWFICPIIFPLLMGCLMALRWRDGWRNSTLKGLVFFTSFYVAHWLPMAILVMFLYILAPM